MSYTFFKRVVDIIVSILVILIFSPIFILVLLVIKRDSPGPVFYLQKRRTSGGREFLMYKFRTMVMDAEHMKTELPNEAEGPVFKMRNDPRVTRFGRFLRRTCLDEIPQFLNILRGEMSLVGPRPLSIEEMESHKKWMELRLNVKPGLTGLWQIKRTNDKKFSEWLKYDKEYIENQSMLLDLKIILLTVFAIAKGTGIH